MIFQVIGLDILLGAGAAWDKTPVSGRMWGVCLLPGWLDLLIVVFVSKGIEV